MGWEIEKKGFLHYEWVVWFSSHGLVMGKARTRKQAEKKLKEAQYKLLVEDRWE